MKNLTILKKTYFSNGNLLVKESQINSVDSSYSIVDNIKIGYNLFKKITDEIEVFAKVDKRRKCGYIFYTGEGVVL